MPAVESDRFVLPPLKYTKAGVLRRVGIELEFTGLTLHATAQVLEGMLGGQTQVIDTFKQRVDSPRGAFGVEIDSSFLKDRRYERLLSAFGVTLDAHDRRWLEEMLLGVWSTVSPIEVISPPIPMDQLRILDDLRQRLHDAGAKGTRASLFYAFGMHLNIEIPSADARVVRDYLRAFILLYPWLKDRAEVDFTRAIAPWIKPFPAAYARVVLDPDYDPSVNELIDDYIEHNSSRNRPLDLLPVLAFMNEQRAMARARDTHLIKPRPAFHYRLPNCDIDDSTWTLAREWNTWVAVERLACDHDRLAAMSREFFEADERSVWPFTDYWPAVLQEQMAAGEAQRARST